jgi:hypothetical protein
MEPEIDRRCMECGAAVRARATFCPQCGNAMKEADNTTTIRQAEGRTTQTTNQVAPNDELAASPQPPAPEITTEVSSGVKTRVDTSPPPTPLPTPPPQTSESRSRARVYTAARKTGDSVRGKLQRVAAAQREVVEEKIAPQVEKLRHASHVVLDEAAEDPNLRFILIAVVLFIISVVLLLVSNYLG